jgi:glycerophosphoryl diester phosphodiesterase
MGRVRGFVATTLSGCARLVLVTVFGAARPSKPSKPSRPQVAAHRGASDSEPEHTLAAYLEAIEGGADALECDIRMTADGHLVCVHDRRVNRTSDGRGLVSTLELAQLEGLDWGSWKQLSAANGGQESEVPEVVERSDRSHLLTLRRLFGVVKDSGRPLQLAVETKHPTRYGGLVERKLVELLREFGWAEPARDRPAPVRMMSFSPLAVRRMHALAPRVPLVYLTEYRIPIPVLETSVPPGAAIGPWVELLREHPRWFERLQARGREIHVWTADSPEDVRLCVEAGAAVIITNKPAQVRHQLDELDAAGAR